MPVGRGKLELFAFGHGEGATGQAGVGLDLERRQSRDLSLFADGRGGLAWDQTGYRLAWDALAGLRMRW